MCSKNSFCGGCGSAIFDGNDLCRSCVSNARERGFSSLRDFDNWHESEFEQLEASEFEHNVAARFGESVETVMRHGFQPRAFEAELAIEEVDFVFLAEEKAWREKVMAPSPLQGDLGA